MIVDTSFGASFDRGHLICDSRREAVISERWMALSRALEPLECPMRVLVTSFARPHAVETSVMLLRASTPVSLRVNVLVFLYVANSTLAGSTDG